MKIPMHISLLTLQLSLSGPSYALQLWYSPDNVPDTFPQACRVALSQNITCSELVSGSKVAAQQLYSTSELNEYCTTSCAESLQQFQQGVHDGCGDQILSHGSISTTGAQLADPLVWAYNVTCLKDVNGYCNPLLFNGSSALTLCSDCVLSYMARMLESEYGRSRFSDEGFARQLSSCGVPATSYPYTTPTSTGAATASTGSPSASPTSTGRACPGDSYTVAETDTCKSIAAENSIPLGTFLADNSIEQNCTTLRTGSEVCLSPPCSLYTVADGDTCKSIIAGKGYYMNQFLSWNPTIHQNCDNFHSMVGHEVCISPPGSTKWDVATTNRTSTMSFTMFPGEWETGPAPTPVTTEVSYPAIPTEFITITSTVTINQTEQSILNDYMKYCPINNIDYDNGFQWIDLSEDCQEILEPYCTPDIDAPSPSSTQFPDSCTPARVSATTTSGTPTPTSNVPSPTMPGTATSCNRFHLVIAGDGCSDLAAAYDISLDDFYTWNPGVGDGCSTLKTEYYVCVGVASSSSASTSTNPPTSTSSDSTPSPTMTGTASNCNKYHLVKEGDACYDLAAEYGISLDNNPGVGGDCSTLRTEYYVCVGVSTSSGPTSTPTSGSTPSPTLGGTAANCNNYHYVEEGDWCYDLAVEYDVSLDDFYTWNPGVGDDCSTLQLGYYVCVGISGSTGPSSTTNKPSSTTSTGGGGTAPTEVMPGTIASCKKYHKVISGDGCWDLASEYGISLDDFYAWNPAVGDDCSALQLDYYVCVGV